MDMEQLKDDEVVRRVVAGDTALFEILMRRHNQRLFRLARAVTKNDADAEDALQQAYIAAYRNLAQFKGDAQVSTWLSRITYNEALAKVRRNRPTQEVEDSIVETRPSPEEQAAGRELAALLESSIDTLPDIYRVVFVMREVEGVSTADTAAALDISEEAVKVRLHRAKGMLRTHLADRMVGAASEAFAFLGPRCDRIVAFVMSNITDSRTVTDGS